MIGLVAPFGARQYIPKTLGITSEDFLEANSVKGFKQSFVSSHKRKELRSAYDTAKFGTVERWLAKAFRAYAWVFDSIDKEGKASGFKEFICFLLWVFGMLVGTFCTTFLNYRVSQGFAWSTKDYFRYKESYPGCIPESVSRLVETLLKKDREQGLHVDLVNIEVEYLASDPLLWVTYGKSGQKRKRKCVAIWNEKTVIFP